MNPMNCMACDGVCLKGDWLSVGAPSTHNMYDLNQDFDQLSYALENPPRTLAAAPCFNFKHLFKI